MRDTKTGREAVVHEDKNRTPESIAYYFGFANGSCDCNRGSWLEEALDEDLDLLDDCGSGRIAIDKIVDERGTVIYSDDEGRLRE